MRQLHMGSLSGLLLLLSTLVNDVGNAVVEFLTWYSNDCLISSLTAQVVTSHRNLGLSLCMPKVRLAPYDCYYLRCRIDWLRTIAIIYVVA
jgi:hypothetical protein